LARGYSKTFAALGRVFDKLKGSLAGVTGFFGKISGVFAKIGPIFGIIATVLAPILAIVGALMKVALVGGIILMSFKSIRNLITGSGGLAWAFLKVSSIVEGFMTKVVGFFGNFKQNMTILLTWLSANWRGLLDELGNLFMTLSKNVGMNMLTVFIGIFRVLPSLFMVAVDAMIDSVMGIREKLIARTALNHANQKVRDDYASGKYDEYNTDHWSAEQERDWRIAQNAKNSEYMTEQDGGGGLDMSRVAGIKEEFIKTFDAIKTPLEGYEKKNKIKGAQFNYAKPKGLDVVGDEMGKFADNIAAANEGLGDVDGGSGARRDDFARRPGVGGDLFNLRDVGDGSVHFVCSL
jgi:phage-related holin